MTGMVTALSIFGIAYAALCVWLTVRIVNRRERWAKWMAVVVVVAALYVLGFGPACWAVGRGSWKAEHAAVLFRPLAVLTWRGPAWVAGPLYRIAGMTDIGEADGLGEIQYAAGYREVLGGSRVYRINEK
jgi:hypothetical protein